MEEANRALLEAHTNFTLADQELVAARESHTQLIAGLAAAEAEVARLTKLSAAAAERHTRAVRVRAQAEKRIREECDRKP